MLWLALLAGSLLGSMHCVVMCSGFAMHSAAGPNPLRSQALYHIGRLLVYVSLGIGAGQIGANIENLGLRWQIPL